MKRFVWEPSARRDLQRIDQAQALAVLHGLTRFARGESSDVKKLTDDPASRYRIRIGDLRVLFTLEPHEVLHILSVESRKDAYR